VPSILKPWNEPRKTQNQNLSRCENFRKDGNQVIREEIKNFAKAAVEISGALVEGAEKGELAPAMFLFEMIGLYPVAAGAPADDEEAKDGADGAEFSKVLLQRLHLPESSEDGGGSGLVEWDRRRRQFGRMKSSGVGFRYPGRRSKLTEIR